MLYECVFSHYAYQIIVLDLCPPSSSNESDAWRWLPEIPLPNLTGLQELELTYYRGFDWDQSSRLYPPGIPTFVHHLHVRQLRTSRS